MDASDGRDERHLPGTRLPRLACARYALAEWEPELINFAPCKGY